MTVRGPVMKQRPDGMSHRGQAFDSLPRRGGVGVGVGLGLGFRQRWGPTAFVTVPHQRNDWVPTSGGLVSQPPRLLKTPESHHGTGIPADSGGHRQSHFAQGCWIRSTFSFPCSVWQCSRPLHSGPGIHHCPCTFSHLLNCLLLMWTA